MKSQYKSSRREFVKKTGAAVVGTSIGINALAHSSSKFQFNADTLKVGLIGCGGRGTGAAHQATKADPNVVLTAVADIFEDQIDHALTNLNKVVPDKIMVDEDHRFVGFDSYKKVLESDVDVVILATPPCFRPGHLEAAINANKHVFCEKPVAVDAPGIHKIIEVAKQAKAKGLALMSGFCWRHDDRKVETFGKVLDGDIGEVLSIHNTYNTGALWFKHPKDDWSEKEKMYRNWIYYNYLSGDHIVEQAVHSIDLMQWAMGDVLPIKASATGGRQSRVEEQYGNVFDHFAVVYEYENGIKGFHFSRQQKDTTRDYGIDVIGSKGRCEIDVSNRHRIYRGNKEWDCELETNNMYQTEHDTLFASIRSGNPFNDGLRMANSTMLAIWGRMCAYTGQDLTWDEAFNSAEKLGPKLDEYNWELDWPLKDVAQPGITKFA